jgi:hypothetical protein
MTERILAVRLPYLLIQNTRVRRGDQASVVALLRALPIPLPPSAEIAYDYDDLCRHEMLVVFRDDSFAEVEEAARLRYWPIDATVESLAHLQCESRLDC